MLTAYEPVPPGAVEVSKEPQSIADILPGVLARYGITEEVAEDACCLPVAGDFSSLELTRAAASASQPN